jgi:hypothetical protein
MRNFIYFGMAVLLLSACTSSRSTQITRSWLSSEKNQAGYDSLYIAALISDQIKRRFIEDDVRTKLQNRNIHSTPSHASVRQSLWVSRDLDKNTMMDVVRRHTKQAIMTISIVDIKETQRYIPGHVIATGPMMMNTAMMNPMWGPGAWQMNAGFANYWAWNHPVMVTPGHFVNDRKYFLEINVYDVETEALIWSAQSRTLNPRSLEAFSSGFARAVINRMQHDGVLKTF